MPEAQVRHPKEELCRFSVLVARISNIEGLPDDAARLLAALVRRSRAETATHLGEVRRTVRHGLGELLAVLDEREETSTDEAISARKCLESIPTGSSAVVERIDIVAPGISVLLACGSRMKEAAACIAQVYPIIGWRRVETKTIQETFYAGAPTELRGTRNEHHDRVRAELERIAEDLELYG